MASSILLPKTRKNCVRSISLPARFHPSTLRIEEELNNLKTWETTTSHRNAEMVLNGLSGLKHLYECVEDVLQLPLTQKHAHNYSRDQDEKLVDEVLDGSVKLLDVCDTTRNILMQTKEDARDLQYGLRRRGGKSTTESNVDAYICSRKKMRKEILKCIGTLKRMESKFIGSSSPLLLLDQNNHLVIVVRVLREVSGITISVFRSLLSFLSAPSSSSSSKPKTSSRWSLVSKLLQQKGQIPFVREQDPQDMISNEVESVHVALHRLSCRKNSTSTLELAQKRLNVLEVSIEGLENGLESMFKCLIKTRVSLLNSFSLSHSRDLIIR